METKVKSTAKATKSTTAMKPKNPTAVKKPTVKSNQNTAEGLRDLFVAGLKDIYWGEKALTKVLPKMAKNATSSNLVTRINEHFEVTKEQVSRLEKVFDSIGVKATAKKCDAMEGLIKEAEGIVEGTESGPVRDAGIIAAVQKIEHYEIATYGTLAAFARILNEDVAANLLKQTLIEEKEADDNLTEVAYDRVNFQAV